MAADETRERKVIADIVRCNPGIEEGDLLARADDELFRLALRDLVVSGQVRVSVSADAEHSLRASGARLSAARVPSERERIWESMLRLDPGMEKLFFHPN